MPKYFKALKVANNDEAFLIISIDETDKFIQFKCTNNMFEIDFPLVTAEQKQNEPIIRKACNEQQLKITENHSSDGEGRFLDIYLEANEDELTPIVQKLFYSVFNADENSKLVLSYNNINI